MILNRRRFLEILGSASAVAGFSPVTANNGESILTRYPLSGLQNNQDQDDEETIPHLEEMMNHQDVNWITVNADNTVTGYTGRTELGQGATTVMYSALMQGFGLDKSRLNVVLGDTDLCPDNGPTVGSSMTKYIVWSFYIASQKLRAEIIERGSKSLGIDKEKLILRDGYVVTRDGINYIAISELKFDDILFYRIAANDDTGADKYCDPETGNVKGPDIVTGKLQYVGDLYPENVQYAAFLPHDYDYKDMELVSYDLSKAERVPGVKMVTMIDKTPTVIASSFTAAQKGLSQVTCRWRPPGRPKQIDHEREIRQRRKLAEKIERKGDPAPILKQAEIVLKETYITHSTTHCPIETDTAVSVSNTARDTFKVWVSSQYPHGQRERVARKCGVSEDNVHIIGMPVGGAFGGKIVNAVARDTALLSKRCDSPVKGFYSRENQFVQYSKIKDIVVVDLETAIDRNGKLLARQVDIHRDEGHGIGVIYKCPHSRVDLYSAEMPMRHAVIRGTSYIQSVFALESHMDQLAHTINMDPVEFRKKNVKYGAFRKLMDRGAEMIGYGRRLPPDTGIGMALVNHGSKQLGAVFAEVFVNRTTGKVTVNKIAGAFDIGIVMNHRTCRMGVEGCFMWGTGFALTEQVRFNGHSIETKSMLDYGVPRFEDLPELDVEFHRFHKRPGIITGIGEMPMVPVTPAIANAVYSAVGIRLKQTPFTPESVLKALR